MFTFDIVYFANFMLTCNRYMLVMWFIAENLQYMTTKSKDSG